MATLTSKYQGRCIIKFIFYLAILPLLSLSLGPIASATGPAYKEDLCHPLFWREISALELENILQSLQDEDVFSIRCAERGDGPLHLALRVGSEEEVIDLLIDIGFDPEQTNDLGETAFDLAQDLEDRQAEAMAAARAATSTTADQEKNWSANIGATSDYLWRGMSFSDQKPAVRGGLDYDNEDGLSVGTWLSQSQGYGDGLEIDFYGGHTVPINDDWSVQVGGIKYYYPNDETANYGRAYVGGTWKNVTVQVSRWDYGSTEYRIMTSFKGTKFMVIYDEDYFAADSSYTYYMAKRSFALNDGVNLGVEAGYVRQGNEKNAGTSHYYHYRLSLDKTIKGFETSLFYNNTDRRNSNTNQSKGDDTIGLSVLKLL